MSRDPCHYNVEFCDLAGYPVMIALPQWSRTKPTLAKSPAELDETEEPKDIIATVAEAAGYEIVRSIVAQVVDPERVVMRDARSYCGALLDDNNRQQICRLRLNAKTVKYLGLIEEGRGRLGVRNTSLRLIDSLDDIFGYADHLRVAVAGYLSE